MHISRLAPIFMAVAAAVGWGVIAIGCSGTNSTPGSDGGVPDATIDGQAETTTPEGDAGSASDGDGGPTSETGPVSDAEAAAPPDAAGSSDADAAGGDAYSATTAVAEAFPGQLATAYCTAIAACCGTSGDAATFNWQACYNAKIPIGYGGSNSGVVALLDGGRVLFNPAQAQTCLNTIATVDCASDQIVGAQQGQLYQSCFGAYLGTVPTGSPCAGTTECAPGNFCLPVDGGMGDAGDIGLCQPLAGDGGACGLFGTQALGETMCSYRGAASNGLFCKNISGDAGTTQLSPSEWTCQPQSSIGSDCYTNQGCESFICHEFSPTMIQCASAGSLANLSACATYVVADAGAD
jgi:hypothetical protein